MASYHLSVKTISRSAGRSATAAAAYRSGEKIECDREGVTHDYTRRSGVDHTEIVTPKDAPAWASDRQSLWNEAEKAETRKNSTVAREFEVALPASLSPEQRKKLVQEFAREIADRHKVAVDVAIHQPDKHGDDRNHHAHLMLTTRQLGPDGLGAKTRELDQKTSGEVDHWRERWAELQNRALERAGLDERVDHRSHADRGLKEQPLPELTREQYEVERAAKAEAARTGTEYEPVTKAGEERHAVEELRGLRPYIQKLTERVQTLSRGVMGLVSRLGGQIMEQKAEAAAKAMEQAKALEQARALEAKKEPELNKTMDLNRGMER